MKCLMPDYCACPACMAGRMDQFTVWVKAVAGETAKLDRCLAAPPCRPIGCDNGIHRPGCPYEEIDQG